LTKSTACPGPFSKATTHKGKLSSKRLVLDPQGVMYSYFTWIQETVRGVEGADRETWGCLFGLELAGKCVCG